MLGNRLVFLLGSGTFSLLSSYSLYSELREYYQQKLKLNKLLNDIQRGQCYDLCMIDSVYFPWVCSQESLDFWEYKLVRVTGKYISDNYVLVERMYDNRLGYMVIYPYQISGIQQHNEIAVNIGWIPKELAVQMSKNTQDEQTQNLRNEISRILSESTIDCLVRSGEELNEEIDEKQVYKEDIEERQLKKQQQPEQILKIIEAENKPQILPNIVLPLIGNIFGINNPYFDIVYFQRIILNPQQLENVYPLPALPVNFHKPFLCPETHLQKALFFGFCTFFNVFLTVKCFL